MFEYFIRSGVRRHLVLFPIIIIIGIVTLWRCDIIIDCGIMASDILALRHLDISTIDTIVVTIGIIVTLYTVWPSCAMAFELWSASRAFGLEPLVQLEGR